MRKGNRHKTEQKQKGKRKQRERTMEVGWERFKYHRTGERILCTVMRLQRRLVRHASATRILRYHDANSTSNLAHVVPRCTSPLLSFSSPSFPFVSLCHLPRVVCFSRVRISFILNDLITVGENNCEENNSTDKRKENPTTHREREKKESVRNTSTWQTSG